jgi:hypothetical protein
VDRASSLLGSRRVQALVADAAAVVAWYVVAPHLDALTLWPAIAVVAIAVIPATLLLVLLALPLWQERWLLPAGVVLALAAVGCALADWNIIGNFAKLWAAVFLGWAFLRLFEQLSWVVLIAVLTPLVDLVSVWRGPTKHITENHFSWYEAVSVKFVVPGGGSVQFGPPDVLFYALFLAAAARWRLRIGWTWVATTAMYGAAVAIAHLIDRDGIAALPFLSFGFLVANGDLLWRAVRRPGVAPSSSDG